MVQISRTKKLINSIKTATLCFTVAVHLWIPSNIQGGNKR